MQQARIAEAALTAQEAQLWLVALEVETIEAQLTEGG
jgi:hypothetical protein